MIQEKKLGRPRKLDLYAGRIRSAEDQVADRLPQLISNLFQLADGIWVEEKDGDGERRVYSRPPDRQANEYLINRILGKPTEAVELSGPDGEQLASATLFHIYTNGRGPSIGSIPRIPSANGTNSLPDESG